MTIERINVPDPISTIKKTDNAAKITKNSEKDSVNLSEEAKFKADIYNATETVKQSPQIRTDRVEEVKKKLQDPSYISDKIVETVAERIMKYFEV
jgi:negative regulator of flagellin synthesis FlgM